MYQKKYFKIFARKDYVCLLCNFKFIFKPKCYFFSSTEMQYKTPTINYGVQCIYLSFTGNSNECLSTSNNLWKCVFQSQYLFLNLTHFSHNTWWLQIVLIIYRAAQKSFAFIVKIAESEYSCVLCAP